MVFAGNYVKEYCERTGPDFVVGEYWDSLNYEHGVATYDQNHHRQQIINWINAAGGKATAFDVTTKGILYAPWPTLARSLDARSIIVFRCVVYSS